MSGVGQVQDLLALQKQRVGLAEVHPLDMIHNRSILQKTISDIVSNPASPEPMQG